MIGTIVLCLFVLLAGALLTRRAVGMALRPVADMTQQAADWSEHDLGGRFTLGPPRDELTALAATLDGLLGRIEAALRHEQRFSAEMAHELRTPLAGVRAEAELALRHGRSDAELREALDVVLAGTDRMQAVIETLLTAARREGAGAPGSSDAAAIVRSLEGPGVRVSVPDGTVGVGADQELVAAALHPLLENAVRHAAHEVRVELARDGGEVVVAVLQRRPRDPGRGRRADLRPGRQRGRRRGPRPGAVAPAGAGRGRRGDGARARAALRAAPARQLAAHSGGGQALPATLGSAMTEHLTNWIASNGLLAVFVLMAIDAVLPAGGELVMLFAGALAAGAIAGHTGPSLVVVILVGTLGYLAGSIGGWALGRRGGRPLVERHGRWLHLGPERFAKAEGWFERFGSAFVFFGRLTPLVRSFVSIPAGVLEFRSARTCCSRAWRRFSGASSSASPATRSARTGTPSTTRSATPTTWRSSRCWRWSSGSSRAAGWRRDLATSRRSSWA